MILSFQFVLGSELYSRSSSIINHSRQRSCPLTSDLNQPFNQSTNPLFNQSTNPLYNQSTNPLFNRPINQPLDQAINPVFNQHWFDQQPLIQPLRQPSNFSNQQPTTKSINQPQQHPANQHQQLLSNQDNLSFLESIRHDGSSRVQTRNDMEAPSGLTGNDATSNGGGKDFHILAPEDDFGEIVFVDTEEERVPEVQVINSTIFFRQKKNRIRKKWIRKLKNVVVFSVVSIVVAIVVVLEDNFGGNFKRFSNQQKSFFF